MSHLPVNEEYALAARLENKKQLYGLLKEKVRRLGLEDLHFMCKHILGYKDLTDADGFHGDFCRHLQRKKKFKLTLTPRGSLKSSVGTIGHTIQDVVKNPNVRILLASKKYTISTAWLGEIIGHFERNAVFRDLYGDLVGKETWTKSEIVVGTRTNWKAAPTISCAGIDVTKVGMHYDIIRVDDPHDDLNTASQDAIDKVIRWYRLLLSLLDPGGYLYITGTIWHYNDLYNYIIAKERERAAQGRKSKFRIFMRDSFEGTNEDLLKDRIPIKKFLWPERLSPDFLRDTLMEQGPYIFTCQYRLRAIDDETAKFKRSWIKLCKPKDVPKNIRVFSVVDPMRSETGEDWLAIDTVGIDENWQCYILDIRRLKADEHDTVDEMLDVYKKWKPQKMGFETVAWQLMYMKYVKMLQLMKGFRLPIVELKTSTRVTKEMRISSMVPYWKAGLYTIVTEAESLELLEGNMAVLVDELTRYPKTASRDTIDALAYINQLTQRPGVLQVLKKQPKPGSFLSLKEKHGKKTLRERRFRDREVRRRSA